MLIRNRNAKGPKTNNQYKFSVVSYFLMQEQNTKTATNMPDETNIEQNYDKYTCSTFYTKLRENATQKYFITLNYKFVLYFAFNMSTDVNCRPFRFEFFIPPFYLIHQHRVWEIFCISFPFFPLILWNNGMPEFNHQSRGTYMC